MAAAALPPARGCRMGRWARWPWWVAAALVVPGGAWWPFGEEGEGGMAPDGGPQGEMRPLPSGMMAGGIPLAFRGVPVIMVQGHFGFDPWEDLHQNVERVVQSQRPLLEGGDANARGLLAAPLQAQIGSLLGAFGDLHAGHFGRAEGSFQVDDDHQTRLRITAMLPGYKLGDAAQPHAAAESPLSVRVVGRRSLVVGGMQQSGHVIRSWQRTFALPKGSDIDQVAVTYNSNSGNLTVDVPRRNGTAEDAADDDDQDDGMLLDELLPPPLRAMRMGLPGIIGQLGAPPMLQGGRGGGFLMPVAEAPDVLGQVLGMINQLHPRFQPPPGGDRPVPEDAEVALVGCFAKTQLAEVELKYYGDTNAASFNAMYWHAVGDHVPYFAMSRHEAPLGHAFTAKGFVHEDEKPKWGVYDGCGTPCMDDSGRWCGCTNEAARGFPNPHCGEGQGDEQRFAVYKIGRHQAEPAQAAEGEASAPAAPLVSPAAQGRPYWQLTNANNESGAPSIEIVVPKGTVAKAKGREVLLYNASTGDEAAAAQLPNGTAQADGAAGAGQQPLLAGEGQFQQATQAPTGAPVGKVRLPVDISEEACTLDAARPSDGGGQVLKCLLAPNAVKQVAIKVIDEL